MSISSEPRMTHSVIEARQRTRLLVLGQSSVRLSQILIVVLLVRSLSTETWNVVALMFTIHLVAVTVGSFNLEHSILYFLPTLKSEERDDLLTRSISALISVGCVLGVLIIIGSNLLSIFQDSRISVLLGVAVACELPTVVAGPIFIADERIRHAAIWDIGVSVSQAIFVLFPAILTSDVYWVSIGFAASSILRLCGFIVNFGDLILRRTPNFSYDLLKRQALFCAPLGVAMASGVLTRTIDKWFVAWKVPESLGAYVVAAQEVPVLSVLPYASGAVVARVMVSNFCVGNIATSFQIWKQQVIRMCLPVAFLTFGVIAIAPEIFHYLFDIHRSDAVVCFQIFSLVGLHRVTEYGAVLRAVGKTQELVWSSVILMILNVVLGFIGLSALGIVGLTVGSLGAFALSWIWILSRLSHIFRVSLADVFPWRHWTKSVAVFGVPTIVGISLWSGRAITVSGLAGKATLLLFALVTLKFFDQTRHVTQMESFVTTDEYAQ